jgi:hypothetical protein
VKDVIILHKTNKMQALIDINAAKTVLLTRQYDMLLENNNAKKRL